MDPLSAIGLVSSIITFIDFGYEVVSAAREVRMSASGTTTANDHIEFLNNRMKAVALDLAVAKPSGVMSPDTQRLTELADKCLELSNGLKKLLDELRAKDPKSKRQVLSSIMKNVRKKDEKKELEARLDQCRQQLHLQLSHSTRLESFSRLDEIAQTGRCQEKELRSLNHQVTILKEIVAGFKPDSKLQDEARTVLDLSDLAVSKVLQNNILEALRFERMGNRFDSIEEAHMDTFKWLLEDGTSSPQTIPTDDTNDPWFTGKVHALKGDVSLRLKIREDFTNWLSQGNGIFHISGKPGAGKSTLMKYLAESSEVRKRLDAWADGKELTFAYFFFWRHGTEFQKSLHGLLRALLYSVLDQHLTLARTVFPTQWAEAGKSMGKTLHFRRSEIQNAFKILTDTPDIYLEHKFAFFVDGLDEFEGHDDTLVKTLFEWAHAGSRNIKICVSSRELPIFQQRFSECFKFRLHQVTYYDIFLFVYDTLRNNEDVKLLSNPKDVADLGRLVVDRAEGVFLWASLVLRLVERGLLLEETIEELRRPIDVLPSGLEQLFRVIFDSIKTEPDTNRRRKAMRTLSLAAVEFPRNLFFTRDYLFLTHVSFMDDFDRNPDFPSHILGDIKEKDRSARLSRCHKQLAGGCRGLLSVCPNSENVLVRKDTVKLAHRSLIEFFQLPEIQMCIEEHTKGFDKLHFWGQALIAELRFWSISSQEYKALDPSSFSKFRSRTRTKSECLYGSRWLIDDLERLTTFYHHLRDPNTSALFSVITQLTELMRTHPESAWEFETGYSFGWGENGTRAWHSSGYPNPFRCPPEHCIVLVALAHGFYEFWPTPAPESKICVFTLQLVTQSLMDSWFDRDSDENDSHGFQPRPPGFDRLLRSLATCLAYGAPANSPLLVAEHHVTVSAWQNLVWHSIVTLDVQASAAPVWLLFLLHGADRDFTLTLEPSCNFSAKDLSSKLICMTGCWGPGKHQTHSPIYINEAEEGILELARRHDWSLSLKDIIRFCFAPYADSFRVVFELFENNADSPAQSLRDLRRELGLDTEFWQSQVWDDPELLLQHDWEGKSKVMGIAGFPKRDSWASG